MKSKIFLIVMLVMFFIAESHAADPKKELKGKGLTKDIIKAMNTACISAANIDLQKDNRFWNGIWNKKGKMVVLDFLQGTKHYSLTLLPLKSGSCQTSRTITAYWTTECDELFVRYKKKFPEGSIKTKSEQDIFMWISTEKGTDIYLYKAPSGCVEVFREFYITNPASASKSK